MKRICTFCGNELEQGAKVCAFCGHTLEDAADIQQKKRALPKRLPAVLIVAGIALAAFFVIFQIMRNRVASFDLDDYIAHRIEGHNGAGELSLYLDEARLEEAINAKIKDKTGDGAAWKLDEFVQLSETSFDGLSNGDVVSTKYLYDNEKLKPYGIAFSGREYSFEVSGLEDVTFIDVFSEVKPEFVGRSPYIDTEEMIFASLSNAYIACSVSPHENLRAGDTVHLEIDMEESVFDDGYAPKETDIDIEVADVDAYIESASGIDDALLHQITGDVSAMLASASSFDTYELFPSAVGTGETPNSFFLGATDIAVSNLRILDEASFWMETESLSSGELDSGHVNLLQLFYECDIRNNDRRDAVYGRGRIYHVYGTILIGDLIRQADGSYVYSTDLRNPYDRLFQLYSDKKGLDAATEQYFSAYEGTMRAEEMRLGSV